MKAKINDSPVFSTLTVTLSNGEKIKAESGAMVAMDSNIDLKAKTQGKGIGGMFKAAIGGEGIFVSEFSCNDGKGEVILAPSYPGDIKEFTLTGNTIFCKGGSFLAGDPNLEISTQGSFKGLFSGTGLFLQKLTGNGEVYINSYGSIIEKEIKSGQSYKIDTGHLLAFEDSINYTVNKAAKGIFSTILSGEGLICTMNGPGKVWIQTRNIQSFATNLIPYLPSKNN